MRHLSPIIAGSCLAAARAARASASTSAQYTLPSSVPANDVFEAFISYSIEFSSFPDYAGNTTHPNIFSDNLLENIKSITGTKPYIRVGGNTQDYALYDASLSIAINGTVDPSRSPDYPTTITIGPSYFESYSTFNDVKFSHGFNLGLGGNNSKGWQTLLDTVPLACRALSGGKLYLWGYGNEPDLFSTSAQGPVRPSSWNESAYVGQWLNGTRTIKALLQEHCPDLASEDSYGYLAPSFGGVGNRLKAPATWAAGISTDKNVKLFSTHNYISGATSPGVTLQGTLLNHTVTRRSVDAHITEYNAIKAIDPSAPPLIFGETNSLYNQGRPGLSNTFGAALWVADFNLYSASVGIKRVQMHMGTNYRYAPWQPLSTSQAPKGTNPPYYGQILAASALGSTPSTVYHIPLLSSSFSSSSSSTISDHESAYAIYKDSGTRLSRIVLLNMRSYNTTLDGAGLVPLPPSSPPAVRPKRVYEFIVPGLTTAEASASSSSSNDNSSGQGGKPMMRAGVKRLRANGSDAITGVTWDGWSYNRELDNGRPVRLGNVTKTVGEQQEEEEVVEIEEGGRLKVEVEDSEGVVLEFYYS
ncbi:Beta-glucuronidase [Cladorrhinum samala]|uniref:Beta-glucuronidase n=1 Tax=Cladorrhinum samala TaxID=585594 RepID=A0AAV9HPV3_9PEZI|nr:Beta-glucuronidase [Cladorrhinum samala]